MTEDTNRITDEMMNALLSSAPDFVLPGDFAQKVVDKAVKRQALRNYFSEFIIYFLVIASLILVGIASYVWVNPNPDRLLGLLGPNLRYILAGTFIFVFVLFTDKVILRFYMNRGR